MRNKFLDFNKVKENSNVENITKKLEKTSKKDIAIIGMYGKFPKSENIREFWNNIKNEEDCIREYPAERLKDLRPLLPNSFMPFDPPRICEAGYLDEIDKFDYEFFNISPREASLMDPNQRLFLQGAWSVIEDAGYSIDSIKGSKTGVYIGHSSDLKIDYHGLVNMANSDVYKNISLPGNVKSIIASRISYLLDLQGPSVVIDTACSSALVAVHLACQGITNGDCEMAIVGGVKINLFPIQKGMDDEIGIRSAGDRAKTFDDSSDGTGSGEGVISILLKPLSKAMADSDNIYAVIKGSATNQDGSSIGLTAPNSSAQEKVILDAWKKACIAPESISYMETHGTATKLGDPIEVSGIERAFKKHTDKKGFCAIGSVKTNIGHLDNIAGIAGLVKLALALKHKEIPATIHFKRPNRKINFIDSPVYINDRFVKWESNGTPLRGGVSSFGLSGTNCHVVLEEYKKNNHEALEKTPENLQVLTLSAKNRDVLAKLIDAYELYLSSDSEDKLKDICYTSSVGRAHHNHRLAVISKNKEDLIEKLKAFKFEDSNEKGVYYNEYRYISTNKEVNSENQINERIKNKLSEDANHIISSKYKNATNQGALLEEICKLYVGGAQVDWRLFYKEQSPKKVSLPTYPFKPTRCWVDPKPNQMILKNKGAKGIDHPLIDNCVVKTIGQEVYVTTLSVDEHWVLAEHKVASKYVMPGTAYLEMIRKVCSKHLQNKYIQLESIMFIFPLALDEGEAKEIHIVLKEAKDCYEFTIASESNGEYRWNIHVEGKVRFIDIEEAPRYDIKSIMDNEAMKELTDDNRKIIIDIGPRWNEISKRLYCGKKGQYLACFEMSETYIQDLEQYYLHPALMDRSINAVNTVIGEGSYLPFSYKKMIVYGPTPKKMYSYIKEKNTKKKNIETPSFDVFLMDEDGKVFVEINDYVIKRIKEDEFNFKQLKDNKNLFYNIGWKKSKVGHEKRTLTDGYTLVFKGNSKISDTLIESLKNEGCSIIEVESLQGFNKINDYKYVIDGKESSFEQLLLELSNKNLSRIINLATLRDDFEIENSLELENQLENGMYSLFHLTRALISKKFNKEIDIVLISKYVNEVTKSEEKINPHNATLFGLAKVVGQEYPHLKCRCVDIDNATSADEIIKELEYGSDSYQAAYRNGIRYTDEFMKYDFEKEQSANVDIKEDGVYLITGGTGGLGLEMGKFLASQKKVKVVLLNRSKMPHREIWDEILEKNADEKVCRAIRAIYEIEKNGSEVICYSADVSKLNEMKIVIEDINNLYGKINGLIHCAGVAGDGFIIKKDKEVFGEVIAPKVQGTWILDKLTENENLDFFMMFSSITSVLGGLGQSDYTAANSYIDSFSAYRNKKGKKTIVINWPAWKEVGMAVDYGVSESENTLKAIPTNIALMVLKEILSKGIQRIIIGELNYDVIKERIAEFPITIAHDLQNKIHKYNSKLRTTSTSESKKQVENLLIKGNKNEDVFSEVEGKIASIWADVLGLEEVNIYDNFESLGGDSILAIQLLKKLEGEYPGMVDISDVFTYSTISDMAEYIEGILNKEEGNEEITDQEDEENLDELLEKLAKGEISVSEAEKYY